MPSSETTVTTPSSSTSTVTLMNGDLTTRHNQVLYLTVATTVIFCGIMAALSYYYMARGNREFEAPFQSGWGVILVTMGGLLRELTHRGL